jgi:TolB-like protein
MKFFEELKKRNVYKAGAAYVVTGWLLLQIVDVIGPGFGWSESTTALLTKILLVGFPIALVLAWLYELTPKGFKRTGTYQEDTEDNKKAGRRLNYFIIGILSVAVCFLLVDKVFLSESSSRNQEASIAVLPFNFLSTTDSLAFMSVAMSRAISDRLGNISGLVVIAQTSSSQFGEDGGDVREIGQNLDVNYLMQGDLRMEGNRIRLSTRLINAANGRVQWQKQYDQEFETIMDLEDDIGDNIVRELRVEVFPDEFLRLRKRITENSEAYKLYLKGSELGQKRGQESLTEAIKLIEEAIVLEPDFAKAHAELVIAYNLLNNYGELSREMMIDKMQVHLQRAQEIDPDLPEVHFATSRVEEIINRDSTKHLFHLREAIRINQNYAPAHYDLSNTLSNIGFGHSAIKPLQNANRLDPYNDLYAARLAYAYRYTLNEPEKAMEILDRMLDKDSTARACANHKARILTSSPYGDIARAFITIHKTREDDNYEAVQLWTMIDFCMSLDLAPLVERYTNLLQWKYPNNDLALWSKQQLNQFKNQNRDNLDLLKIAVANNRVSNESAQVDLAREYFYLNEYEKAEELLDKRFPELAKTLDSITPESSLPPRRFYLILFFVEIFKAKGEDEKVELILDILYRNRQGWGDDYYSMYPYYYYLKGEVDSFVQVLDEAWFESKLRGDNRIFRDYKAGEYKFFEDNPVFEAFISKVTEETHRQRAKVIEYLKEEGDWDPAWDKELGLNSQ